MSVASRAYYRFVRHLTRRVAAIVTRLTILAIVYVAGLGLGMLGLLYAQRLRLHRQAERELLLDGEVVAFDGDQTSFSRLQQRLGVTRPSRKQVASYPVVFCVFDLLEIDGEDLTGKQLLERRARLAKALRPRKALQLSEAWRGDSRRRFARACRSGWEGLIAKRADAPYARGRSRDWLKLKCAWEQELVIGGYTDPGGSRTDFGALLVGYYEDGQLRYAGKVGTGYTAATLRELGAQLRDLETDAPPFVDALPVPRGTHWTRPELVAQIRHNLGLDKPWYIQYLKYLDRLVFHFDFGYSYQNNVSVKSQIFDRLPATLALSEHWKALW